MVVVVLPVLPLPESPAALDPDEDAGAVTGVQVRADDPATVSVATRAPRPMAAAVAAVATAAVIRRRRLAVRRRAASWV